MPQAEVHLASTSDVDDAVRSASAAFPLWSQMSGEVRRGLEVVEFPDRIGYVHLKHIDQEVLERVGAEQIASPWRCGSA